MSSDVYTYCKLCRINHTLKRKHVFTKKHKLKLKTVLQNYGQKIKDCRPYLSDPVIQEGDFEFGSEFWCHCCDGSFQKHVTDHFKTILYGGVIEHLASESHWTCTEKFFADNGADEKFKISFIVSQTDMNLYKSKLEPMVDVFNDRKEKKTLSLAKQIESQEISRKLIAAPSSSAERSGVAFGGQTVYKTVKNKLGVVQNPSGNHDGVRVWKAGIVKYKKDSDQRRPFLYPSQRPGTSGGHNFHLSRDIYTVSADSQGLTPVSIQYNSKKGNIHSGAIPPWLRTDGDGDTDDDSPRRSAPKAYGPSIEDLTKHLQDKKKRKLNPKRVGANFDHTFDTNNANWLPSFGRVWNQGARWKSRHEYKKEVKEESQAKKPKKT